MKPKNNDCARHIGDIGHFEPYRPCNADAIYEVAASGYGMNAWMACRKHAEEVHGEGCEVSEPDGEPFVLDPEEVAS